MTFWKKLIVTLLFLLINLSIFPYDSFNKNPFEILSNAIKRKLNKTDSILKKQKKLNLKLVFIKGDKEKDIDNFYIGKYEVTQEEWFSVMGKNPSYFKDVKNPVEQISWLDAIRFCNRLSAIKGLTACYKIYADKIVSISNANGFRLPKVNEWNYVAENANLFQNSIDNMSDNSSTLLESKAWFHNNSDKKTHLVGHKKPNKIGIYDLFGNVWEWCWNPTKNDSVIYKTEKQILKGGSWFSLKNKLTNSVFELENIAYKHSTYGLRVVKNANANEDNSFQKILFSEFQLIEGKSLVVTNHQNKEIKINDFLMGKYEVTQGEWEFFMGTNPSKFKGKNNPVENVSWLDAVLFCNKKSISENLTPCYQIKKNKVKCDFSANGFRLPTEVEWILASGEEENLDKNNFPLDFEVDTKENSLTFSAWFKDNSNNKTHPVGEKLPNKNSLHDVFGNVAEWCWDKYSQNYKQKELQFTGSTKGKKRILKGSSWNDLLKYQTNENVDYEEINFIAPFYGFRLAKNSDNSHINSEEKKIKTGTMIYVHGGSFKMGSNHQDNDEKPKHDVVVKSFYISPFEITQEDWNIVMPENPSFYKNPQNPVENVTWNMAIEYCIKRSEMEGLEVCYTTSKNIIECDFSKNGYRLPTEEEWEFSAKDGIFHTSQNIENTNLFAGNDFAFKIGWYMMNSDEKPHSVGEKLPNKLGLYDMSGNVSEWCWNWYNEYSYDKSLSNQQIKQFKIQRGGSFYDFANNIRTTKRFKAEPQKASSNCGFRVAKSSINKEVIESQYYNNHQVYLDLSENNSMNDSIIIYSENMVNNWEWNFFMEDSRKPFNEPVTNISWYDAILFCNKKSLSENLIPNYIIDNFSIDVYNKSISDSQKWVVYINAKGNGYRIPTAFELIDLDRYKSKITTLFIDNTTDELQKKYPIFPDRNPWIVTKKSISNDNISEWTWDWFSGKEINKRTAYSGKEKIIINQSKKKKTQINRLSPELKNANTGFRVMKSSPENRVKNAENSKYQPQKVIEMIFVEGGHFSMGADIKNDIYGKIAYKNKEKKNKIKDFIISKTEVTQSEWTKIMGNNPSKNYNQKNYPIDNISWLDAVKFCNEKSKLEGFEEYYSINDSLKTIDFNLIANGYRLPWYNEWEYVSNNKNTKKLERLINNNSLKKYARFSKNSGQRPHKVKSRNANELGLYDLFGNVSEWCNDSVEIENVALKSDKYRLLCGGSYSSKNGAEIIKPQFYLENFGSCEIGFRLARNLSKEEMKKIQTQQEKILSKGKMIFIDKNSDRKYVEKIKFHTPKNNLFIKNVFVDDFFISNCEISQSQFVKIMGYNPSNNIGINLPVDNVNWYEAIVFCNEFSKKEGLLPYYKIDVNKIDIPNYCLNDSLKWKISINKSANGYRLPTEAQWEYSSKGGNKSRNFEFSGSNLFDEIGWCKQNSTTTNNIGTKQANEIDLFDMSGNLSEWCWDWSGKYFSAKEKNPIGINNGCKKIIRGGNFKTKRKYLSVYFRDEMYPYQKSNSVGFRIVKPSAN